MEPINIAVSDAVLEANGDLPPAEPHSHGLFENAAGHVDEFVPGATDSCPQCYAKLNSFFVGESSSDGEFNRHRPLLSVCPECDYVPYKDELVRLRRADKS